MSGTFLGEMGFVQLVGRKLSAPHGAGGSLFAEAAPRCLGRAGKGWVRKETQVPTGGGTQACPCLGGLFPSPSGDWESCCDSASFSCLGFGRLWLRCEEALCSPGSPALPALCRSGCGTWSPGRGGAGLAALQGPQSLAESRDPASNSQAEGSAAPDPTTPGYHGVEDMARSLCLWPSPAWSWASGLGSLYP